MINIFIRTLVLLSRFFFLFALAKLLEPAEIGRYGLLVAAVGYSIYFVGLDFYIYTTRQVSGGDRRLWGGYIKSQAALSGMLYLVFFPVFILLFAADWLPWSLLGWFFVILILEHICLELIRFFIAASEQLTASVVLFFNQAFWAVAVVIFMVLDESYRSLSSVLFFWVGGSVIALCYSALKIKRMNLGGWRIGIDLGWIWSGIKIAIPMLLATLTLRGIFTFDRYLLSVFIDIDVVAVYILFIGVAGTLLAFLDAAVFSFSYPGLIESYKKNNAASFKRNVSIMLVSVAVLSVLFSVCSLFILPYLLVWIDKSIYFNSYYIFYWVLGALVINAFWMVFHYALYAQQLDRHIIASHLAGFFVFLVSSYGLYFLYPRKSILIGLCLSQGVVLLWKFYAYQKKTPKPFLGFGWK